MIATRLGLAIAGALALVLAIVLAVDLARDEAPPSRALVAIDTDQLARLAWARPGQPDVVVERTLRAGAGGATGTGGATNTGGTGGAGGAGGAGGVGGATGTGGAGGTWRWTAPVAGVPADAGTIDTVVAALRGGRWHRRAARARAGTIAVTLTATAGARTVAIGVGAPVAGTGQTWLALGDHAYLVDDWLARALAPAPLALRETRPLRDAAAAKAIAVERAGAAVRVEGTPRRLARPVALVLAPARAAALHAALASLTIRSLPQRIDPEVTMTISIDAGALVTVEVHTGGCGDGEVAIGGTPGPGCVAADDLRAIEDAASALARAPAAALADPQPVRFDPVRVTLADGGVLDLAKRPRIGDHDADLARVGELLIALQAPAPRVVDADAAMPARATLTITDGAGTAHVLELLPASRVRRRGEPVVLELAPDTYAILARGAGALRDPTLWREEPTTIRTITIDGTTFARGAVLDEWTRTGPGKDDPAAASELARALAQLAGTEVAGTPRTRHTLTFETAPPAGAPVTRTLQIGDRCHARVDGRTVALAPEVCALIARLR